MNLRITGNVGSTTAIAQSLNSTRIGASSATGNINQSNLGGGRGQVNSLANGAITGGINSNNGASQLVTLSTDVCDFNIIPRRAADLSSSGSFQSNAAGQLSAQGNSNGVARTFNLQSNTAPNQFSQSSPVNNFPAQPPINPFAVQLSGNGSAGSSPSRTSTSGSTNGAQVSGQAASQSTTGRNHSITQDGIVIYEQTGPIDPVTNTAPGSADFLVFSDTTNNQQGAINLAGQSISQGTTGANNDLRFGVRGPFDNYSYSLISVG